MFVATVLTLVWFLFLSEEPCDAFQGRPLVRDAEWAQTVFKDATPGGLRALAIPKAFYTDFEQLFARGPIRRQTAERRDDRTIRLGYHCSFMNSDTIRFIMSAVLKRHDRKRSSYSGIRRHRSPDSPGRHSIPSGSCADRRTSDSRSLVRSERSTSSSR